MKLSSQTKEILKSYANINQNILIKNGSELKTVSAMKNIVASATVPDTFTQDIPIYNLNEFCLFGGILSATFKQIQSTIIDPLIHR